MNKSDLTIETAQVEIKVIRVGGHKMTKAVFDQIQIMPIERMLGMSRDDFFNSSFSDVGKSFDEFTGQGNVQILGHVVNKMRIWLIFSIDDELRKTCITYSYYNEPDTRAYRAVRDIIIPKCDQLFIAT